MTSRPVLQFSLTALFILTTVSALALSALLGISRFFGISVVELLWRSLGQFIYSVPMLVVWTAGLSMAVRRLRSYRKPAIFTIIGLTGFMVTILLVHTIQMGMIASMNSRQVSVASVGWVFAAIGAFSALIHTGCWIFILAAIFSGRPVDPLSFSPHTNGLDPFRRDEPPPAAIMDDEEPFRE